MDYIWIFLTAVTGGFLQSIIGFGFGIIAMLLFSLFFEYMPYAAAVSMLVTLAGSIWMLRGGRWRKANLKKMLPVICTYFVVMPFANKLSMIIPKSYFGIALAAVLIALAVLNIFFEGKVRLTATLVTGIGIGVLAGVLGGMFNMSGSAAVFYCLVAFDNKEEYMSSIQAYYLVTNIYGVAVRAMNGLLTSQVMFWGAAGIAGMVAGMALGSIVFGKITFPSLRKWVYGFIGVSGIWMIITNI